MLARGLTGLLALALLAALFVGGAQPAAAGMFAAPWDKLAHLAYFTALTLLLLQVLPRHRWLCVGIALLVGATDEMHQLALLGREPSLADWCADAGGAALGLLLYRACNGWNSAGPEDVSW